VTETREQEQRPSAPPPLEANDQLVTGVVTAGWAVALVVLLIVRDSLPAGDRWWIWTCVSGLVLGLFGLWYVPRMQRGRARAAARRASGDPGPSGGDAAPAGQAPSGDPAQRPGQPVPPADPV
jgi:hypothetical protein